MDGLDDDDYYDEEDDEKSQLAQLQDGIEENPTRRKRRGRGRRRSRRSLHRYPHKTHQRRRTDHSFADQGPTHYGQQHPYHAHVTEQQTHPLFSRPAAADQGPLGSDPAPHKTAARKATAKQTKAQKGAGRRRRHQPRHIEWNDSELSSDSSFNSSEEEESYEDSLDYESSSNYDDFSDSYSDEETSEAEREALVHRLQHHDLGHQGPLHHASANEIEMNPVEEDNVPRRMLYEDQDEDDLYDDGDLYGDEYDDEDDLDDGYYDEDANEYDINAEDELQDEEEDEDDDDLDDDEEDLETRVRPKTSPLEIDIAISERKKLNDIIEIPTHAEPEHDVHQMADNDMESSDLNFSEDHREQQEEHAYQIQELGDFELDRTLSEDIQGLNKEESVDFSDGHYSSDLDHKMPPAANLYSDEDELGESEGSYTSSSYISEGSSNANQLDTSFESDDEGEDEWDRFVQDEGKQKSKPVPKKVAAPAKDPAPAPKRPAKKPAPITMPVNAPAEESELSSEGIDDDEYSSSEGSSGYSSSSSSTLSSSSSSTSSSGDSLFDRRNELGAQAPR